MAPFIGLTGGIGAGKSTALAAMERLGAATLSTDRVVHELYESDEVRRLVVERFGPGVIRDGEVDRGAVARDKRRIRRLVVVWHAPMTGARYLKMRRNC